MDAAEAATAEGLSHLLLDATTEQLSYTREAQLSVLLASLLAWDAIEADLHRSSHEIVGFAGHSLGQVTALIAAGSLTLHDGVRFAAVRASATQLEASQHPGRMAALVGATVEQAEAACAHTDNVWIANDNAPGQVVIAGTEAGVSAAIDIGKTLGIRKAIPLAVGGAFHTPLMEGAVATLVETLTTTPVSDSGVCVVSNADALPYTDASGWIDRLAKHPTQRVLWRTSMETLIHDLHADAMLEVGHGTMIAGMAKRTVPGIPVFGVASPETAHTVLERIAAREIEQENGQP